MTLDNESDEDLMKRCQSGDEHAFEILFSRHELRTLDFIYKQVHNETRTEAIAQEAFLRIFKDAKRYQYPQNFVVWFDGIVRELVKNKRLSL